MTVQTVLSAERLRQAISVDILRQRQQDNPYTTTYALLVSSAFVNRATRRGRCLRWLATTAAELVVRLALSQKNRKD